MFSDTQFWRLVWKEYRTQRPLWLTLLIAAPVLQVACLVLIWVMDDFRSWRITEGTAMALLIIGYLTTAVYVLGCGATLFSVEHETGTFEFQRVLPANQPRVFWAKIGIALTSSLAIAALLALITRGVFVPVLPTKGSWHVNFSWFVDYGGLLLAELFVWSVLCSLLIKQPLWGVLAAISVQSSVANLALPYLTGLDPNIDRWACADERLTGWRVALVVVLAATDVILGRLWFEDRLRLPRWRFRWRPDLAPSISSDVELPPYLGQRQLGWTRLMWLGWRDSRCLIGGMLAWHVIELVRFQKHGILLIPFVGSFLFGLFAFVPDQWAGRFRFFTERGCSPRWVWLSRQIVWLPPVLLMTLSTSWVMSPKLLVDSSSPDHAAFEQMALTLGPLLCYSAGQFAALLIRSTVVAMAVGLALTFCGFLWGILMSSWLAPAWWSVGSLPVIVLFATWLRANDWIEERRDRVARWRLALGLGIPIVVLLATCATYRVVQIPVVTLPAEWDESDAPVPLTAAETETLDLYRRAVAELEAGNRRVANHETRIQRSRQEHPDWTDDQRYRAAFDGFHKDWLTEQSRVIPLLREAHARPAVPLALLQPDLASFSDEIWMPDKAAEFSLLTVRHARQLVKDGQLDEAWQEIELTWELLRRYWLRAAPVHMMRLVEPNESLLWEVIADWGRHPNQSTERIIRAILRLEQLAGGVEAARHTVHRSLMTANLSLFSDQERRQDIHKMLFRTRDGIESTWKWNVWRIQPWERWRTYRVLRWRASLALSQIQEAQQQIDANQPLVVGDWSRRRTWNPIGNVLCETTVIPPNFAWAIQVEAEHTILNQAELFRAARLQLALLDWHREHGRCPRSLDELVPKYFTTLPLDPTTTSEFIYFPDGRGEDITYGTEERGDHRVIVPKGIPFLVSSNSGLHWRPRKNGDVWEFTNTNGLALKLEDVLVTARIWLLERPRSSSE